MSVLSTNNAIVNDVSIDIIGIKQYKTCVKLPNGSRLFVHYTDSDILYILALVGSDISITQQQTCCITSACIK